MKKIICFLSLFIFFNVYSQKSSLIYTKDYLEFNKLIPFDTINIVDYKWVFRIQTEKQIIDIKVDNYGNNNVIVTSFARGFYKNKRPKKGEPTYGIYLKKTKIDIDNSKQIINEIEKLDFNSIVDDNLKYNDLICNYKTLYILKKSIDTDFRASVRVFSSNINYSDSNVELIINKLLISLKANQIWKDFMSDYPFDAIYTGVGNQVGITIERNYEDSREEIEWLFGY